jgi:hypothetical protein
MLFPAAAGDEGTRKVSVDALAANAVRLALRSPIRCELDAAHFAARSKQPEGLAAAWTA